MPPHSNEKTELDPRITLAVLRQLVALPEHGSMSAVARHLHLSQPTVSANLARLEDVLGVPLLMRATGGSRLTPEGELIAQAARPMVEAMQDLAHVLSDLQQRPPQSLRIAASLTIAEQLVPRWLADRRISHPIEPGRVVLKAGNSVEVMAWVSQDEADIGFVEGNRFKDGLEHATVGHDELVLVVGPGHRWFQERPIVEPAQLAHAGLVVRERGSGTLEVLEDELAHAGVTLPPRLPSFSSTGAILTAVRHGGAVAVVSRLTVEGELASGELVELAVKNVVFVRNLSAVWRKGLQLRADAQGFVTNLTRG